VNFNKLNQLEFIKKVAKNVNISHSYRSTYSMGSFVYNPDYSDPDNPFSYIKDQQGNFISRFDVNSISINEQFNPLINFDVTWKNNLTSRFQISKSRRITLSFANNQISESLSNEYSMSMGYRF
jgi:cell surface protein SprA